MTIDTPGLRTQPRPRQDTIPDDQVDHGGDELVSKINSEAKDALSELWQPITPSDLRPPPGRYVPPSQRRKIRTTDPTRTNWRAALDVVRPHHQLLDSPALRKAADELAAKVDAVSDAADLARSVDVEQAAERASHVEAARASAATGGDAPAPVAVDWEATRAARLAIFQDRLAEANRSASHYRAVLSSEAKKKFGTVIDTATKKRAKALAALKAVESDVHDAIAASEAARLFEAELNLSGTKNWHRWTDADKAMHSNARRQLDGLRVYLGRTDPAATGSWVLSNDPSLPAHTRDALAEQLGGSSLARLILTAAEQDDAREGRAARSTYGDPSAPYDDLFVKHHLKTRQLPR